MRFEDLPYRPCVGMMVLNRAGLAFIGRRIDGPEHVDRAHAWQMPQGGIDPGEQPWPAALRELREETNIRSVERIGEIAEWLKYDIPRELVGQAWKGKYRGQTQKWFALRFTGARAKSTSPIPPARQRRNSRPGVGSRCKTSRTSSCRSSARFTSGLSRNSPSLHRPRHEGVRAGARYCASAACSDFNWSSWRASLSRCSHPSHRRHPLRRS